MTSPWPCPLPRAWLAGLVSLLLSWPEAAATPAVTAENNAPGTPDVREVLDRFDRLWFGVRSTATVAMTVRTAHYERVLRLTYWVDGKDRTLIRIQDPPKEKGTATLKNGADIYNFLPRIGRTVKVSAALRTGAWMGSHFTNDDLLKASRLTDDYDVKIIKQGKSGKSDLLTLEMIPRPSAAVPWSRILLVLDHGTAIPVDQEFYGSDGQKLRTIHYSDVKELGGRLAPARVKVIPAGKPDEFTDLIYESIDRTITFAPEFFSVSKLANQ